MSEPGAHVLERALRIPAPVETVWLYWIDPVRMASWWGEATRLDAHVGGAFRVQMQGGSIMVGEFLEIVPPERIVFRFGWDGVPPGEPLAPCSTRVEVTLAPDGTGTLLRLRHQGIPKARSLDHSATWEQHLAALSDQSAREA
jgi:uncharacterized protein YndB with AHSA1/START domain